MPRSLLGRVALRSLTLATLFTLATLGILTSAMVPPAKAQDTRFDAALARGDAAYARLDNAASVQAYDEALAMSTSPYSFELLARLSRTLNDYGLDLWAAGRDTEGERVFARAVEYAEELSRRFPDRPESWFLLAAGYGNISLYKGGREKVRLGRGVEEHCLRSIRVDPTFSACYAVLGIFYREVADLNWVERTVANTLLGGIPRGSYALSEEMLRKALTLQPVIPLARYELGRTLLKAGKTEEARRYLDQAITMRPISTLDVRNAQEARRLLGRG